MRSRTLVRLGVSHKGLGGVWGDVPLGNGCKWDREAYPSSADGAPCGTAVR